ncbi:hypothetical protein NEHOM01_0945 [Nematocida homosporus]|uniref:uncharacterized protein n=1 Tax=Nematocida homosporus TaxID=1912981 RepID=UPI0022204FC9|nr:uncharacterized protein NEHOM01_0945 [Nematocida homosporus]KAI5185619.1 hypothetical protein NEHOM01_0945 [Nematocida homosporus]
MDRGCRGLAGEIGDTKKTERMEERSIRCECCSGAARVLLSQSGFCKLCFIERFERSVTSEVRKGLVETDRKKVRRVLCVLENTLASDVLYNVTTKNKSVMVEYAYCTLDRPREGAVHLTAAGVEPYERVGAVVQYGVKYHYDCVVFSQYSAEVADILLRMIAKGEIDRYPGMFVRAGVNLCYPFYSWTYKSIYYYALVQGLFKRPNTWSRQQVGAGAHQALIRDLLKNSPHSILNLIKVQQKISHE